MCERVGDCVCVLGWGVVEWCLWGGCCVDGVVGGWVSLGGCMGVGVLWGVGVVGGEGGCGGLGEL